MSLKHKKPSAASRTMDMYSVQTAAAVDAVMAKEVHEDVQEAHKQAETIEVAAERWRNNAFFTQEHLSKHFNESVPGKEKFRLTLKDGWRYLEKFSIDKSGGAYHYCGVMFRDESLYELTGLFVAASKEKANAVPR